MNSEGKLIVCLYSDPNFLAVNILESLLSKNCLVNIVTDNIEKWQERTSLLSGKNRFGFCEVRNVNKNQLYDYVIFCGGFIKKESAEASYKKFCSLINFQLSKTLILFPFEVKTLTEGLIGRVNDNCSVIYLGDLLGPRIDLDSDLLIPQCIGEIITSRNLTLAVGEVFYPLFTPEAVRLITKWLFAFGPYGKEIFLLGSEVSTDNFWKTNGKLVGEIKFKSDKKTPPRILPKRYETEWLASDLNYSLTETYKWLSMNWSNSMHKKRAGIKLKLTAKSKVMKKHGHLRAILLTLILLLLLPVFSDIASLGSIFIGYKEFVSGNDSLATSIILFSRTFATVGNSESSALSYIPIAGYFYREVDYTSGVLVNLSEIAGYSIPLTKNSLGLFDSILGNVVYNPSIYTIGMAVNLSDIYTKVVQIQSGTEQKAAKGTILAKVVLSRVDFGKYEKLLSQCQVIINQTPEILGSLESKTYLLLFENNMELRPTGGFIGSYGLLTFDGGRLSDFTVSDVYSADGQLNGHVEPPAPIKQYLGEANWWLRDSNWDPDFPTSAKRAEWFLNKEISRQVDGVIAIDLFPIKDILKATGPIFLSDYSLDITSDNLYEEVQAEVQNNFFPGTHQKASFLTGLSRSLLSKVGSLDFHQKASILLSFYESLEERHLQLYMHDTTSQDAIENLGWDGSVTNPDCGSGCYADTVDLVEANLGVNKANYFVQRSARLDVNMTSTNIQRTFTLNLTNSANSALGLAGKYKNYVRLLVPDDATDISVKNISGLNAQNLNPDIVENKGRKEIGVLVDVLGGQSESVVYSWESPMDRSVVGSYGVYIRKQAGVDGYPMSLSLNIPVSISGADSRFALTGDGIYVYNTTLASDLYARFILK